MEFDSLSHRVIGCALEVHKALGPGLLESAYEQCLAYELDTAGIAHKRQVELPVKYKGMQLDCAYRMDIVVDDSLIVEIKSVNELLPIHEAQLITNMKLSGLKTGLLMNFNERYLKDGINRKVM